MVDTKDGPQPEYTPEQINRLWELGLHEDQLFTNRVNFMLVAEAMLFAAFATLLAPERLRIVPLVTIAVAGIIVSLVWFYVSMVQIQFTSKPIQIVLKQCLSEYRDITSKRRLPIHRVIGGVLPILLIGTWIVLIVRGV